MSFLEFIAVMVSILFALLIIIPIIVFIFYYILYARQESHSVLRNYPVLVNVRYLLENIGPELRQYLFSSNREGKPFSRHQYINIVKAGKYKDRIHAFGSERTFDKPGFYISNRMFP